MNGYQLSGPAKGDLLDILLHTMEQWGEKQVPIYLKIIETALERIAKDPFTSGSKSREDLATGCRTFRAGKHYFVYRIKGARIEIGRILHESMDFERQVDEQNFA